MKIGLVRHFKVKQGLPEKRWLTARELTEWFQQYDESDVEYQETDLGGIEWSRCFASDMPRAVKTAKSIYGGEITLMSELREVPHPVFSQISQRKLPFLLWAILTRAAWKLNRDCFTESKPQVRARIEAVLDGIERQNHGNVLIVGHAALFMEMRNTLLSRGFAGPKLGTPANGKLYLFEK